MYTCSQSRHIHTKLVMMPELSNTVCNLSSRQLTKVELEVLSRGPKFGIPPKNTNKEAILSEFEILFTSFALFIDLHYFIERLWPFRMILYQPYAV